MTPRRWALAAGCAALVLATRLPYLASTLDDIDAVNFALATGDFNPALHQPHPPGFPVYVLLAKLAAILAGVAPLDAARALAALSAVAQAALPLPLFVLFRRLGAPARIAAAAAALSLLNPVVWMNGVRPMSDSVGLLVAVAVQALVISASSGGAGAMISSLLCGLAAGVRVQIAALTVPLWAHAVARRPALQRAAAAAVLGLAVLAWAIPTVLQSGGPAAYRRALGGTAADAADVEPLVFTWSLHHAVGAARHIVLRPWGAEWLGLAMALLGIVGVAAAWRRGASMRLAVLAFAPYLVAHALFQQAHTQRYAMPYVPLLALLATLGLDAIARLAGPRRDAAFVALAALAGAAATAVALPGVSAYAAAGSPAYAAMREVRRLDVLRPGFALAGHYMFSRFMALAPSGIPLLALPKDREMAALEDAWLAGERRPVLLLAEPRRTDLQSLDPASRARRGQWSWPPAAARLLSGERPASVDLVEIQPPRWFAGVGWALSLEMKRHGGAAVRTAYLRGMGEPGLVMFAGEPTDGGAGEWEGALAVGETPLDRRSCGTPWLAAYVVAPATPGEYRPLAFATTRAGVPGAAPFALRGLAYGAAGDAMLVIGDGWHSAETAEDGRPFRWATRAARAMVNVPPSGARLVAEGEVPRHVGGPATVTLEAGDLRRSLTATGRFRIELDISAGPPREAILRSDRDFVPDDAQRNGDRRRLALRVERFEITGR